MKYCITIIAFFLIFGQATAQQPEIVKGQLLLRVKTDADLLQIVDDIGYVNGKKTRLSPIRQLSNYMGIWQMEFDYRTFSHDEMIYALSKHSSVLAVQLNRKLKNRATIPNDPNFGQQWQYVNTGASGGVADADIDADEAWDITTGGLSAIGDSLVVCVIDDGLDLTHTDMQANRWYNWNEIPGNGIDDDGNGYIDDFNGWDAYDNDDNINGGTFGGGHGTPVAGIIGAKGNNGIGVSGVNWDVKLMIVVGGGNEAQAIAAYDYPLTMRRMYNQSNGQLGAFVVATNASWGIDNALASSAPIWCAMYDSLGAVGVLNAGATANANTNVDVQGDLPTQCPSDFLISVTNTNRSDQKITSAGYGATSIDLGAPGEGTYTVAKPNNYGAFGGTSGATPHVTGTIALIYSAPCSRLALMARTDPAGTALLVKDFILQGVDSLTGLQGITVTGGRLNTFNSLQLAMQSGCSLDGCYQPFGLAVSNITDSSANLSWNSVPDASLGYILRYRVLGSGSWNDFGVTDTFLNISGLVACTDYEWQVSADCDTVIGNYSNIFTFRTANCCLPPSIIQIDNITENVAQLSWSPENNAISYDIEYREQGDTIWMQTSISDTSISISGLMPCTEYELRIISVCSLNINNEYSQIISFRTNGCGNCIDLNYCSVTGEDASYEWISSVVFNTLNNNSGDNGGYMDFTSLGTDLFRGNTYTLSLSLATSPSPSPNWRWKVWIDYNQDGDFDDNSELVFSQGPITSNTLTVSGTVEIPDTVQTGNTRMRVGMKWGSADLFSCTDFAYGEVEDYCININENPSTIENNYAKDFQIFPNPADAQLTVIGNFEGLNYEIIDISGRRVLSGMIQRATIEVASLPSGMYIIRTDAGHSAKFVKR